MGKYEKELIRMELQLGQLIRIVANLNERLEYLEAYYRNTYHPYSGERLIRRNKVKAPER